MSRHAFLLHDPPTGFAPIPIPERPCLVGQRHLIVGWDRPLATFFFQVLEGTDDEEGERILAWEGCRRAQFLTAAQLAVVVRPWAELSVGALWQLEDDQKREGTR